MSQIKNKKEAADQKRGQLFSKLLAAIAVAARENPDPEFNPRLRTAVLKAREANVPGDNIERAIKRSSELKDLQEVIIEAYGPEGLALLIFGITDNKNRTIAEVRTILNEHGSKIADPGNVLWSFENLDGAWQPKFQQSISEAGKQKLAKLVELLEEREDVEKVITNTT